MRLLPIVTCLGIAMMAVPMVSDQVLSQNATSATLLNVTIIAKSNFCGFPNSAGGQYGNMSLIPTGIRDVGIISICSNGFFVINVNSANGGIMTSPANSYSIPYQIKASATGGSSAGTDVIGNGWGLAYTSLFTPSTTPTMIFDSKQGTISQGNGPPQSGNRFTGNSCSVSCDIKIQWQITTSSPVPAGTYTDTIIYTLTNN